MSTRCGRLGGTVGSRPQAKTKTSGPAKDSDACMDRSAGGGLVAAGRGGVGSVRDSAPKA